MADWLRGAVGGGIATLPTLNPFAIALGALGGGILGALDEKSERERNRLIGKNNLLTFEGMRQQNLMNALNLRKARRMEYQEQQQKGGTDIIGKRLSELFSRIR